MLPLECSFWKSVISEHSVVAVLVLLLCFSVVSLWWGWLSVEGLNINRTFKIHPRSCWIVAAYKTGCFQAAGLSLLFSSVLQRHISLCDPYPWLICCRLTSSWGHAAALCDTRMKKKKKHRHVFHFPVSLSPPLCTRLTSILPSVSVSLLFSPLSCSHGNCWSFR